MPQLENGDGGGGDRQLDGGDTVPAPDGTDDEQRRREDEEQDQAGSADETTARPTQGDEDAGATSAPVGGGGAGQQTAPGPEGGPTVVSGAPTAEDGQQRDQGTLQVGPGPGEDGPRVVSGDQADTGATVIDRARGGDGGDDGRTESLAPAAGAGLGAGEVSDRVLNAVESELEDRIGRDLEFGQDFVIQRTETGGFRGRPTEQLLRDIAGERLEQQLEEATGMDVTPGEEFEVVRTDQGFEAQLSGAFAGLLSREAAREAGIDLGEQADRAERRAELGGPGPALTSGGLSLAVSDLRARQEDLFQEAQGPGVQGLNVELVEQFGERRAAAERGVTPGSRFTGTGFAGGLSPTQLQEVRERIEQRTGLEAGEDFTLDPFGNPELTEAGRIEMAGRPETGQTFLDAQIEQFEQRTGVDAIPGEGDVIQDLEASLARAAQVHREGRGLLPNAEQAVELSEAAFPLMAPTRDQSESVEGIARRIGARANPAGAALGFGQFAEGVGEFGFNVVVGAPGFAEGVADFEALTGREAPESVEQLAEAERGAQERLAAQAGTAAAAAAFIGSETVESVRERPFETAGSALTEAGLAFLAAEASPARFSRARVPLDTGETATLRGARLQTPRFLERAGVSPRGRTVLGLRTGDRVRPSIGAPGIDLRRVAFEEFERARTGAIEPVGVLETESLYGRGTRELARTQSSGRLALERAQAVQNVLDIGAQGRRGSLIDPSTEAIVRNVKAVPRDKVDDVSRALEELDATVKGSAAVRAQLREAREPRDLDIVVDDIDAAKARLNEALEGANADVGDVFDFAERSEFPAAGELVKFGERAPRRLRTEGGVRVTSLSEELVRKAGAAGFIRGAGVPESEFVGRTGAVDVGPEPVGSGLPRFKDPADAATIARAIVAEDLEAGLLTRRAARRQAQQVREFEDLFSEELAQPSAIQRGRPLETAEPAASGLVADIRETLARFDADERGQVTLGLPGRRRGGLLSETRRTIDEATDLAVDIERRADGPSSAAVRRVDGPSPSPLLVPSGGAGAGVLLASSAVVGGEPTSPSAAVGGRPSGSPGLLGRSSPGGLGFPSGGPGFDFGSPTVLDIPSGGPGGSPDGPGSPGPPGSPTTVTTTVWEPPLPPPDFPDWPGPPPRTPRRDEDEDQPLPWEDDELVFGSPVDEAGTPLGTGWFNEFLTAFALGAGPRGAPSQSALAAVGDDSLTEQLPTLAMLSGTEAEQAEISEAADLFFASEEEDEPLL